MTQLEGIVGLIRMVLGTDAVGAYLHGSAVLGELRPRSDVDVLVVSARRITDQERRTLLDGLLTISGNGEDPASRPVELTVAVQSDVRPWRYPPRSDFQYGEWLRADYERGIVPAGDPASADLAPLITMVLLGDRALFGPPPADVFDPVPHDDLIRAIVSGVPDLLLELDTDTRNVILTLARIWTTVATGAIRSKDAAADWAMARLPEEHRPPMARARAVYLGDEEERWDDLRPRLRPLADHILGEISAGARAGRPAS